MTIEIRPFSIELRSPIQTANGILTEREGFIVIFSDEEIGIGEATPLPGWTESITRCKAQLRTAKQIYKIDGHDAALAQLTDTPAARHGVSLAVTDNNSRARKQPLYRHLGQNQTITELDVNTTIASSEQKEILNKVDFAVEEGFRTIKIKIGLNELSEDIETLQMIRTQNPQELNIRADVNGNWNYDEVVHYLPELRQINLEYLEQPFPPEDLASHKKLREESIPVALDETIRKVPVSRILSREVADFFVIKPMSVGGIDKARSIALTCLENDILPVITTTYDSVIARTGAVHLTASLPQRCPAGLATGEILSSDIAPEPAPVTNGRIAVPQSPGIGIPLGSLN